MKVRKNVKLEEFKWNFITKKESNLNPNVLEHYIHSTGSPTIVYGAASKGIIKRDQQNNAVVYKTFYAAANPFQHMDPVELEKYKKEVAEKQIKQQGNLLAP